MAKKTALVKKPTGKLRTREHIIADLSLNYVERMLLDSGYIADRKNKDYGYDLIVETFDERGNIEPGLFFIQLKATDTIGRYAHAKNEWFSLSIDRRDYRLWTSEMYPVLLVLFDALRREAYWQHVQAYFANPPTNMSTKSLSVRFPKHHVLGIATMEMIRQRKNDTCPGS